jgi:hypothetical protein
MEFLKNFQIYDDNTVNILYKYLKGASDEAAELLSVTLIKHPAYFTEICNKRTKKTLLADTK